MPARQRISESIPVMRGFRIRGHSTSVSLKRALWEVLDAIVLKCDMSVPRLIERMLDGCMVANDKNLSSCLRVVCRKYCGICAMGGNEHAQAAERTKAGAAVLPHGRSGRPR